jgi:nitrogen-specific signal transduction histidine kinase
MTTDTVDDSTFSGVACLPCRSEPATYFAPAGRDSGEDFRRKTQRVQDAPFLQRALDAMPSMVMVLNDNRQIVAANETLLAVLNTTMCDVLSKRPGEAVGCMRAKEGPDGCGTARHCATCGAVNAILESQTQGQKVVRECRILVETPSGAAPLDLRVTATPFSVGAEHFTVAAIEDISQPNRLAVLQRTFFHDVLNTAGCIQGYSQYLVGERSADQEVCERLADLAGQLIEAIQNQRDLFHAESGDLKTQPVPLQPRQVLDDLCLQYRRHSAAEGRCINVRQVWDGTVITDRQLLLRVLGNMLKNALEATPPGGSVSMDCRERGEQCVFSVHNAEIMPEGVQLQLFQRSFSTKGQSGRGIGTYSMKLFGERYLGGEVDFLSRAPEGTIFSLAIPKAPGATQGGSPMVVER